MSVEPKSLGSSNLQGGILVLRQCRKRVVSKELRRRSARLVITKESIVIPPSQLLTVTKYNYYGGVFRVPAVQRTVLELFFQVTLSEQNMRK